MLDIWNAEYWFWNIVVLLLVCAGCLPHYFLPKLMKRLESKKQEEGV